MAMAKCRECGSDVSDAAKTCPKCGVAKPVRKTSMITKIVLGMVALGVLGQIAARTASRTHDAPPTSTAAAPSSTPVAAAKPASSAAAQSESEARTVAVAPQSAWRYSHRPDAMSNGVTHFAEVESANTVELGFPYAGPQHGRIALRTDPRHGKDVLFSIERGQILCHSYEDCTVLVRFDDEEAMKFAAVGPSDNSTETVFIRNYDRFVGKLAKAKRVRIAAELYQEGAPVFEFDVTGFDPKQYRSGKDA